MPVTLADTGLMPLSYASGSPFLFTPGRRVLCKSAEQDKSTTVPQDAPATPSISAKTTVAAHPAVRGYRTRPASVSSSISTPPSSGYSSGATSPLSASLPSSPIASARGSLDGERALSNLHVLSLTEERALDEGERWWREQEMLRQERSSLARKLLCIIVESSEADAFAASAPKAPAAAPLASIQPVASSPSLFPPSSSFERGRAVAATPFAKRLAAQQGIDLAAVVGSGPGGRVLASDLACVAAPKGGGGAAAAAARAAGAGGGEDGQLASVRRTIARRLAAAESASSSTPPPMYCLTGEIAIDRLLEVRERLNGLLARGPAGQAGATQLSVNDFIVKASALACLRVPEASSACGDTFIRQNKNVDVSVAVSTPAGLVTPIILNAHAKGLATISSECAELAARAREGKLRSDECQGGTFTVSSLGMAVSPFSSLSSSLTLPQQSCILAIGGAETRLVPDEASGYKSVRVLRVTLSADYRTVDGAVGAQWLKHFKQLLESPHTMLL